MNWNQLRTVIWLRWRLTQNQFSRGGKLNAVITILGMVGGLTAAAGAGVGGVFAGAMGLSQASPMVSMLAWDAVVGAFLFMWAIGVVVEIQRSESIDLARMLHLPVSLEGIFVMNYIASLVTMSLILFLPAMMGVCIGLVWASGPIMMMLVPLALTFIFMVSAWTYCLRGWLIALMVNPRRRRTVIAVVTLTFVLLGQLPNLYFNVFFKKNLRDAGQRANTQHHHGASVGSEASGANWEKMVPPGWIEAHDYVPLLWLPKGAKALAEGNVWPAVLGSLGAFILGAVGLARAYRSTMRFYLGQESGGAPAKAVATNPVTKPRGRNFLEKHVPFVAEDTAALALAFFRSLSRAPEVKMGLLTSVIVLVAFVPLMMMRGMNALGNAGPLFYISGAAGFTFFGLLPQMFNLFGYDREGFRSLVLSPSSRRNVLLAKNISLAPVAFGMGAIMLTTLTIVMHLPILETLAGLIKVAAIFLLLSVVGNLVSIWVPYRVTAGSLKPTKPPAKTVLLMFVTQMLFPVVVLPIFLAPLLGWVSETYGWWPAAAVDGLVSLGLLAIAVVIYAVALKGLGEMLEDREQNILLVVSREGE